MILGGKIQSGLSGSGLTATGGVSAPSSTPSYSPTVTQPTGDYRYLMTSSNAEARYQSALNDAAYKEGRTKSEYGFDPEFASNPYTRANLLARAAQQRYNTTTNSMASRGQLYSGALDRARAGDEFTSGQQLDEARNSYQDALQAIEQARIDAGLTKTEAITSGWADYADRLLDQQLRTMELAVAQQQANR